MQLQLKDKIRKQKIWNVAKVDKLAISLIHWKNAILSSFESLCCFQLEFAFCIVLIWSSCYSGDIEVKLG